VIADRAQFIRDNTRLQAPPHAPEIQLYLADEITPIWRLTEEELGEMGLPPPFWAFAWAEVILAGDICYEKPLAERVMAWLRAARDRGAAVLIGDPGRSYFPRQGLEKLAEYQVPTTRELEDFAVKRTSVWTLDR
jgi:predicted nicotinamide N-methyase